MEEHKADNDAGEGQSIAAEGEKLNWERTRDIELAKFKAQSWDRLSTQLVTVSLFTPVVGILYKVAVMPLLTAVEVALAVIAGFTGAYALHLIGDAALRKGYEQ